jgi:hypothetical protein
MAKGKKPDAPATIPTYITTLEPTLAVLVETVRQIILDTDPEIGEQIKWNSPSFFYTGDMKPFDPKEYKRDIAVMNLHKGYVLLVLPTGAIVADRSNVLEGNYTDGRRLITIKDVTTALQKKEALQQVIKAWLALVEK